MMDDFFPFFILFPAFFFPILSLILVTPLRPSVTIGASPSLAWVIVRVFYRSFVWCRCGVQTLFHGDNIAQ